MILPQSILSEVNGQISREFEGVGSAVSHAQILHQTPSRGHWANSEEDTEYKCPEPKRAKDILRSVGPLHEACNDEADERPNKPEQGSVQILDSILLCDATVADKVLCAPHNLVFLPPPPIPTITLRTRSVR